jgi:hypothetical protein
VARKRIVIAVFVDAFGWKILGRHDFLPDLLPVRRPLRTVLGYSSTCIPTILTGRPPREHGHFSCFYHDPARSPFGPWRALGLVPACLAERGRFRGLASQMMAAAHGFTGYFQIYNLPFEHLHRFDYAEKHDLYRPGGVLGGVPTLFDRLRDRGIPFFLSDWHDSDAVAARAALAAVEAGGVELAYLSFGHLDAVLHEHGTSGPAVDRQIEWVAERIREVAAAACGHYDEVRLHVFSDHGMADVGTTCDLADRIDAAGLRFGEDFVAVYDSTMARFWFLRDSARDRIAFALAGEPRGRTLDDAFLSAQGCDFPDRRYGDLFWLADPGVVIVPSFMGRTAPVGMHGYDPADEDSVASYLSNVPVAGPPAGLADLHGLLLREVGR